MRGTTVKKLSRFADLLVANTRKDDPNPKTKPQLMKEHTRQERAEVY
jgi:hypothetical protein